MKLAHPLLSSPIAFCENQIPVLVLENAAAFREFAVELLQQSEGQEGAFVLSRADRCLDCAEHLNVFLDFLHPPELEKRLQSKLESVNVGIHFDDADVPETSDATIEHND